MSEEVLKLGIPSLLGLVVDEEYESIINVQVYGESGQASGKP